ncbi:uncharacterized protein LOC127880032 isoform X2 [Dreissena polymorpha]|uniref:uncharacterized protein LOC127880032 isoform X2 n=1 Tax=Dreissena polymorpha TaxID=45954 RepID=UPI0022642936|nr:uncharacterized protein LOC127880032 isoform X2 [Dreissena polymorpha]
MHTCCALFVCLLVIWVDVCHGYQCCTSYTDPIGTYHPSQLCEDYCCWDISFNKVCCDNPLRQVPSSERDQDSCTKSWIEEHIWVPIVCGLVLLGLIVLLTCCCCCACCRRSGSGGVVIRSAVPQTNVIISTQQSTNVMHAGYNQ